MRRRVVVLGVLLLVAAGLGGLAVRGHDFVMKEQAITLPGPDGVLNGVLALPEKQAGPVPVVVFVHGDGAVDATRDGQYRPSFEALAKAGVASVSWNKPGVGGSAGNWLEQNQADRAREVATVVTNLRQRAEAFAARERVTPVLLILAGHDRDVDAHETEHVYQAVLGRSSSLCAGSRTPATGWSAPTWRTTGSGGGSPRSSPPAT
ncbi:alpha/beta hydrolase family protein [Actinoplanes derwentensis]|uniref:Alpha/beta hydrolase family protein n=1 Tax=Actinoplanes derwentensis TaxID=113562 RepID=A0A1H1ZT59_9ACTN|nr:hypothetical protein [Actinoplanes derwentensis]GID83555.1 hypothetical protein Ade03nite_24790 [Actinoplanes derwentensis]SDT36975.1 hypothetical protein SAMN04489716_3489 [Actinoplanes derwentensis]